MAAIAKRVDNFAETDIDGEIIIMRLDNGELLSLADTAAATWRLIDGRRDRGGLVAALEAQYANGAHPVARDVDHLIGQLKDAGLVAEE